MMFLSIYLAVLVILAAFTATVITHGLLLRMRWYRIATNNMLFSDYLVRVGGPPSTWKYMAIVTKKFVVSAGLRKPDPPPEIVVQPRSPPCSSLPFGLLQMKGVRDRLVALRPSDTYPQAPHEQ